VPNFPDKIIINSKGNGGMHKLIKSDLETLRILGIEIMHNPDLLSETVDLRDKMKALCDAHYKAQMEYHHGLKSLIEETAARIDAKLLQT
jgi:hypothetical protein